MDKIKILFLYKAYPFTIANYFRRALERRPDVELITAGEFFGQWIPWQGGMQIPNKYTNSVDIPLSSGQETIAWESLRNSLPWTPDLILNVDAGFHLRTKPDVPYYLVATDPHVLGDWYKSVRPLADKFYNMQSSYMGEGDILLPYAFDPSVHYVTDPLPAQEYDCSLIGLHYPNRNDLFHILKQKGIRVNYTIGQIFDEYREENLKSFIGINWSSLNDVTARVFEIMAMGQVPVFNRLKGIDELGLQEGVHYYGFDTVSEAVDKIDWILNNKDEASIVARNARTFVYENNHTYDARVQDILDNLIGIIYD